MARGTILASAGVRRGPRWQDNVLIGLATLDRIAALNASAIVPGRGDAVMGENVTDAINLTRDFLSTLYGSVKASAARGESLKQAFDAARKVMDPKFKDFAIYEHCLPFNIARAYDEARGIKHPRIWTAQRDLDMWAALQGT